jgi:hypothetical protein|tara:strand:+ start:667 stop:837 length:171 start_codon:yes stop_codon:yes gene_type:complete
MEKSTNQDKPLLGAKLGKSENDTTKQDVTSHSREIARFLYNIYRQASILKEGPKDD